MKSVILVVLLFGTYDSHCTHHFTAHDHAGACRGLRQSETRTSDSKICSHVENTTNLTCALPHDKRASFVYRENYRRYVGVSMVLQIKLLKISYVLYFAHACLAEKKPLLCLVIRGSTQSICIALIVILEKHVTLVLDCCRNWYKSTSIRYSND